MILYSLALKQASHNQWMGTVDLLCVHIPPRPKHAAGIGREVVGYHKWSRKKGTRGADQRESRNGPRVPPQGCPLRRPQDVTFSSRTRGYQSTTFPSLLPTVFY